MPEEREGPMGPQDHQEPGEAKEIQVFQDFLGLLVTVARKVTGEPLVLMVLTETRDLQELKEPLESEETRVMRENPERKDRQAHQERRVIKDPKVAEDSKGRRARSANRDHVACRGTWEFRVFQGRRGQRVKCRPILTSNKCA